MLFIGTGYQAFFPLATSTRQKFFVKKSALQLP